MKASEDGVLTVEEMVEVLRDYFGDDKEYKQIAQSKVKKLKKK